MTVPRQVLEYLDIAFPQAKEQIKFSLGGRDAAAFAHLLRFLDAVPPEFVSLEAEALASFGESVETIRIAVDAWRSGISNHVVDKLDRYGNVNPLTLLPQHLASLPEIPVPESVDST